MPLPASARPASALAPAAYLPVFLRDFHRQLRADAQLAPLFPAAQKPPTAPEYQFWQRVFSGNCYLGRPFPRPQVPPQLLAVYERWQQQLGATLQAHLPRTQAAEALAHASNVAVLLQHLGLGQQAPVAAPRA